MTSLPVTLLGIHSAVKEDLRLSPAELVFGRPLRLPADVTTCSASKTSLDDITTFVQDLASQCPVSHSATFIHCSTSS